MLPSGPVQRLQTHLYPPSFFSHFTSPFTSSFSSTLQHHLLFFFTPNHCITQSSYLLPACIIHSCSTLCARQMMPKLPPCQGWKYDIKPVDRHQFQSLAIIHISSAHQPTKQAWWIKCCSASCPAKSSSLEVNIQVLCWNPDMALETFSAKVPHVDLPQCFIVANRGCNSRTKALGITQACFFSRL